MAGPNLVLISELQTLTRRDFPLVDPTLLNPLASNPLVDGEWLELATASYALQRGASGSGVHEGVNPNSWVVHTERGRYDTQAIGKTNVLMLGMYEAETAIVNTTSLVIGSALTVQDVTIGGQVKRGLALKSGSSGGVTVVGYVSRLPGGGKVRFVHYGNQVLF